MQYLRYLTLNFEVVKRWNIFNIKVKRDYFSVVDGVTGSESGLWCDSLVYNDGCFNPLEEVKFFMHWVVGRLGVLEKSWTLFKADFSCNNPISELSLLPAKHHFGY